MNHVEIAEQLWKRQDGYRFWHCGHEPASHCEKCQTAMRTLVADALALYEGREI